MKLHVVFLCITLLFALVSSANQDDKEIPEGYTLLNKHPENRKYQIPDADADDAVIVLLRPEDYMILLDLISERKKFGDVLEAVRDVLMKK